MVYDDENEQRLCNSFSLCVLRWMFGLSLERLSESLFGHWLTQTRGVLSCGTTEHA